MQFRKAHTTYDFPRDVHAVPVPHSRALVSHATLVAKHVTQTRKGQTRTLRRLTVAVALTTFAAGCASAPLNKPIQGGPVDTGAGSLEAERRQLQGTWSLLSYELHNAAGVATRVDASAQLTYDDHGNLTVQGHAKDPKARTPNAEAFLNYKGRAVIDPDKHELRLLDVRGNGNTSTETINIDAVRHYQIQIR